LPAKFLEIVEYISAHFCDTTCTVNNICETFYISKSTLCRHFRQYFRTTPSDYIESKRFSEAKKLLLAGMSVQSTCFSCGFSDCSYFIMRFRKKFGVTPYKYQKISH
jgi:AraC-like DNA-binding protein